MSDLLPQQRVAEIAELRDRFGGSRNMTLAPVFSALDDLLTERVTLMAAWQQSGGTGTTPARCPISAAKREALIYAATGHTVESHAETVIVSASTIRSRRQAAFRELGVRNISEAIGLAVLHGWITPADLRRSR